MLTVENLSVSCGETAILNRITLHVAHGSTHVLLGPNGSGKSTFMATLMAHPHYRVTEGEVSFKSEVINAYPTDKRARMGMFYSAQHLVALPGVSLFTLLSHAYRSCKGVSLTTDELESRIVNAAKLVGISPSVIHRSVHEGFSGGERKKLELIQLIVMSPDLALLDEIDSGLDIDARMQLVRVLELIREACPAMSVLIITHYPEFAQELSADMLHLFNKGTVVYTGDTSVVSSIARKGYDNVY